MLNLNVKVHCGSGLAWAAEVRVANVKPVPVTCASKGSAGSRGLDISQREVEGSEQKGAEMKAVTRESWAVYCVLTSPEKTTGVLVSAHAAAPVTAEPLARAMGRPPRACRAAAAAAVRWHRLLPPAQQTTCQCHVVSDMHVCCVYDTSGNALTPDPLGYTQLSTAAATPGLGGMSQPLEGVVPCCVCTHMRSLCHTGSAVQYNLQVVPYPAMAILFWASKVGQHCKL